ncbi:hypothetical protein L3V83_13535 [Thiotrichales bacterium 19X7-9]|nr:hypothetical protein [Thiotrichales bacterium 19X7-9]
MSSIFFEARKLLLTEMDINHNYAEIADFLFFRANRSKYIENGKPYFLLPNVQHIIDHTCFKETVVRNALFYLKSTGWIESVRVRCHDGAVRTKIFITEKFKHLMAQIESLKINSNPTVNEIINEENYETKSSNQASNPDSVKSNNSDSMDSNSSDSMDSAESYIIDNIKKENNKYINNSNQVTVIEEKEEEAVKVKSVNFELDLSEGGDGFIFAKNLAESYDLDLGSLLMTLSDYYETSFYSCIDDLVADAISALKRIDRKEEGMPKFYAKLQPKKATFHAEDQRQSVLTPLQQVAISQLLHDSQSTGKAKITNVKEVFAWIEFQIINPDHHFVGKTFKHILNIIKNLLCKSGKQQYSKPHGFQSAF